ncbi:MAG: methyltransferase domain-containing protein [Myxococcales bacterium]|nr:methyltransferase domain-containing protein [Myxococcales bacterium]
MTRQAHLVDPELGPLTHDRLTADVRVWQRRKGHRFSSDDVATAYVAWQTAPEASSFLDLGCGLGSVLLLLAWKMPGARAVGIEAQAQSFALLQRNVAESGFSPRITIHHGDLRDEAAIAGLGSGFDLVTGTPPYFPPGHAIDAADEQRTRARIETRGGVEAYVRTATRLVGREGAIVICGDSAADPRVLAAASLYGARVTRRCDAIPRVGRPPLFSIWTLALGASGGTIEESTLTLRDAVGMPADGAAAMRAFSGFPPR